MVCHQLGGAFSGLTAFVCQLMAYLTVPAVAQAASATCCFIYALQALTCQDLSTQNIQSLLMTILMTFRARS